MADKKNNIKKSETMNSTWSGAKKFLKGKRTILIAILAVALFGSVLAGALYQRSYTSAIFIYPRQGGSLEYIMNEGGSETVGINFTSKEMPFEAYENILRSPEVQMQVLRNKYGISFRYKNYRMDLMQYFSIDDVTYALSELNKITEIEKLDNSSAIKIAVTTRYPELAGQIAEAYVGALEDYLSKKADEDMSGRINNLENTVENIQNNDNIDKSLKAELISSLQKRRDVLLAAGISSESYFESVTSGYIAINNPMSRFQVAAPGLIIAVIAALGLGITYIPEKKKKKARARVRKPRVPKAVTLTRGPEIAPAEETEEISRISEKQIEKVKTSRAKRAVKV